MPLIFPLSSRNRRAERMEPPPKPLDQYDPLGQGLRPPRRGLGGLFGGRAPLGIMRRQDGDPGTLLNHILYGSAGVSDMRNERMNRDLFNFRIRGAKLDEANEEAEREQSAQTQQMVQQVIARLPPEQQAEALLLSRLDPDGFARRYLGAGNAADWQHGQGYSHMFLPNPDGTITLGDPLPLRPRQGQMGYSVPDSDEWEPY